MKLAIEDMKARIERLDRQETKLYREDYYYADHLPDEVRKFHKYYLPICYNLHELGITEDEAYKLQYPEGLFTVHNLRRYGQGFAVYFDREKLGLRKTVRVRARERPPERPNNPGSHPSAYLID